MPDLAHQELLFTIAEIAAAFVGFSMVVGLLSDDRSDRHRFHSIRDVAEVGLTSLAAALLPSAIHAFGFPSQETWRLASTLCAAGWLIAAVVSVRRFTIWGTYRDLSAFFYVGPFLSLIGLLLLCWNAVLPDALSPARYVLGLLLLLAFAGISFISATFHGREDEPAARAGRSRRPFEADED